MTTVIDVGRATTSEPTYFGALPDDKLCHIIIYEDGRQTYCGYTSDTSAHGTYGGEAICPVCGCPTCPKCVQLLHLDLLLLEER